MSERNGDGAIRVYCAGPLFNEAERREMTEIADAMQSNGYAVYLPHRDGMEFRLVLDVLEERGWEKPVAGAFLHAAIFALDVYQLAVECDAMVWNLNGRVPDEGAVSEAAMAWTLGKPLVAFADDVRTLIAGRVNPLLVGLVDFQTCERIDDLPALLSEAIEATPPRSTYLTDLPPKMRRAVSDGRMLWAVMQEQGDDLDDAAIADMVEELFAPSDKPATDLVENAPIGVRTA
ncbi:nucleoside 2-deoxyribosyltransferase [Stratiformator vulcanicus]|uniref:Nucleoside 2-deoxyribosyltransferase n=1 Tax=Stratiformator vulcanicus TaxID=2527980 RepID=A0A517QX22_9PLAN|nr:nucleoside 2-deoxyribosyltransferase [Stratiformator vulcanicus]QDT36212.1 Nucleoside 2-deoxyribosyltransferase [Stratiformator vulcanicus]